MDGFEMCRQMRSDVRLRHVPVALPRLARPPRTSAPAWPPAGNDFILKPFGYARAISRVKPLDAAADQQSLTRSSQQ